MSEETPPVDCEEEYGTGYYWDWSLGKCVASDPAAEDDWWDLRVGTDAEDENGSITAGFHEVYVGIQIGGSTPLTAGQQASHYVAPDKGSTAAGLGWFEVWSGFTSETRDPGDVPTFTQEATTGEEEQAVSDEGYQREPAETTEAESGEDAASVDETYEGTLKYDNKPCEEGFPISSDFVEGTIALLDILAPDADDWEDEIEGSILMDSDFDSTFSLDGVLYTDGFESGESMCIAFTAFADLWGEENHIYWDYMNSGDYAPVFTHSYYDEESEAIDSEYLAEGYTTVEYYSSEEAALKERFGGELTWAELIDLAISSLHGVIQSRQYGNRDLMIKHRYDIFKFGVFSSLPYGGQASFEESDLGSQEPAPATTTATSTTGGSSY